MTFYDYSCFHIFVGRPLGENYNKKRGEEMKKDYKSPPQFQSFYINSVICICFLCFFLSLLIITRGQDYSLFYSEIASDSAISETTDYEIIDLVKITGIDGEIQISTDYLITHTTGLKEEPPTRADTWMLY